VTTARAAQRASHRAEVAAPAAVLYELVAEAATAPLVFPGTVHVEVLEHTGTEERLDIWGATGDQVRSWTSHRVLDRDALSVTFEQEAPVPPIASMRGVWHIEAVAADRALVGLDHAYRAVGDDPGASSWIASMVDEVSNGQLAALRRFSALGGARLSLGDGAALRCPVGTAQAAVRDAAAWADLPAVAAPVTVRQAAPDMDLVDMTVAGPDGARRTSRLARVHLPGGRIVFKEMSVPGLVAAHTGCWRFEDAAPGSPGGRVLLDQTVVMDGADAADGRSHVRRAVSTVGDAVLARLAALPTAPA
jgi:aromatase